MYVSNAPEALSISDIYECGEIRGKYLVSKHNIPVLFIHENGGYVFSNTSELQDILAKLPLRMKIFSR